MFLSTIPDPVELDDYAVHQRIMSLTEGRKALFQRKGTSIDILTAEPLEGSRDISSQLANLTAGQSLLFTIRLNPVVSQKLEKGQRGKRRPVPAADLKPWVARTLEKNGARATFSILSEGPRFSRKGASTITLSSITVSGVLKILDADALRTAISTGIGHGKAMGFGMLNIFDYLAP
jgi:CRISPR-associated protein Cas6/Cse3/CasE subtype I-E